jgi:hypothetical protein
MNRTLPFDPDRRARVWLGVAVLAFTAAVAMAYFCVRALEHPTLVGGFDRPVATAAEVVRLPTIEVVARRSVVLARDVADAPACTTC